MVKAWGTSWVSPSGLRCATGLLAEGKYSLPVNYTERRRSVEQREIDSRGLEILSDELIGQPSTSCPAP